MKRQDACMHAAAAANQQSSALPSAGAQLSRVWVQAGGLTRMPGGVCPFSSISSTSM